MENAGLFAPVRLALCATVPQPSCMRPTILLLLIAVLPLRGADADADWKRLVALDAGPGKEPATAQDALKISLDHIDAQEKALRAYLKEHPDSAHEFDAKLRLARLLGMRAELKDQLEPDEADRLMKEAEEIAKTPQHRADLDFMRVSQIMRRAQGKRPTPEAREAIMAGVRRFQKAHPQDPRIAVLLLETSTLFEGEVKTKEGLLREASRLTSDPALKAQIADDTKRIAFLGRPLALQFTGLDGKNYDARSWRGRPAILVFFASASEPARVAFADLQEQLAQFGNEVVLIGVSLDAKREETAKFLEERKSAIPVAWDGKGWSGEIVQRLGINAVPSAWLIDPKGVVRSLDALEDPAGMVKQVR
jgi:peroxiredoxin